MADIDFEQLGLNVGPASDLLKYYRGKLHKSDSEREELLGRIADIETQNADLHRLRWENKSRTDEVADLQKGLQDAKLYLYDEREQVLKLQAENDNLKSQEMEDRRRIQQLLALTQPLTEEYTFFRDARPVSTSAGPLPPPFGRNGFPIRPQSDSSQNAAPVPVSGVKIVPSSPAAGLGASRVIRTIGLEQQQGPVQGSGDVATMRKQLEDFRRLSDDRTAAFARDRQDLLSHASRRAESDACTIRQLETAMAACQGKLSSLTRDYLLQRHHFSISERQAKEEAAAARAGQEESVEALMQASSQADADVSALKTALEGQARQMRALLASKLEAASDGMKILAAKAEAEKRTADATASKLKEALRKEKEKNAALTRRRALDIEGYKRDVTALRKTVRTLELRFAEVAGAVTGGMPDDIQEELDAAQAALDAATQGRGLGRSSMPAPSRASPTPTTGRATLAGYTAAQYAAAQLAEVLEAPGEPFPGDLDYDGPEDEEEEANWEGQEEETPSEANGRPFTTVYTQAPPPRSGLPEVMRTTGTGKGSGSSGKTSPSEGSLGAKGSGVRLSGGGARRVPITSPEAAARYDSGMPLASPPSARSRAAAMQAQLDSLRDSATLLEARASMLKTFSPGEHGRDE